MTLEDFFTLTEMKDGLTAPSRVAELLNVMQKEKDSVTKNVGDATRQWAAVASTIAATENKDCLDLFVQLDGLGFLNEWLKDAQKYGNDTSESFVEESINALLRALEKLQIDNERSISSGISSTVQELFGHNSSKVQDSAKKLFDSWKQAKDCDPIHQDIDDGSRRLTEEDGGQSALDSPISRGIADEENHVSQHPRDELSPSRSSEKLPTEKVEDVQIPNHNDQPGSHVTSDHNNTMDRTPDSLTSSLSKSLQENISVKEVSPMHAAEGTDSEACCVPVAKQGSDELHSDVLKLNESSKNEKQLHKVGNSSEKVDMSEISSASGALESGVACNVGDVASPQIASEPAEQIIVDSNERDVCWKTPAVGDARTSTSDFRSGLDDKRVINHCSGKASKVVGQEGECCSSAFLDLSANGSLSGKPEDLDATLSRMEDTGEADEDKEHSSDEGDDLTNSSDFPEPAMDTTNPVVPDNRRSNIELEYGIVDALEVARQVAQEVEREVEDYRQPFCSSSSERISGGIRQPGSPDSINGNHNLPTEVPQEVVPAGQSHSTETNPEGDGGSINSGNLDNGPENCALDMESSQVTEAAQEPEVNAEKGPCEFDLNQEVSSDEMDFPANHSTAISLVAASRPAAAPGLPLAPLQFEGSLGWKGCAATSAFRPASPRRIPEGDKTVSIGGTHDGSKQRHNFLDIDLNIAEGGDELGKQVPLSSGLPSGESSVEVSPIRSGRLNLDLNCIGDDGEAQLLDSIMGEQLFNNRSSHRSPSPASSSSSMQQPFLRNIDLNDRPYVHNDALDHGSIKSSQFANAHGVPKLDVPVISIMGTRVEVDRKDFLSQAVSMSNGKSMEPTVDASMTRAGGVLGMVPTVSYAHSPVFGYNGLTAGPTMSFSSAVYGPTGSIPYMVDSRGAPVVPQLMGSASTVPPAYPQSAFIMRQPGINSAGPSRPNFDLNSGFMMEGGNRDSGGFRQLLIPGQGRSVEEHLRTNLQSSSSSGIGTKRKEPDGGWEPYPFNYKHQQPPWK